MTDTKPIVVYPNPVSEVITIELAPHLEGPFTFQLFHMAGTNIVMETFNSKQQNISLEHIPSGIYLYTIEDENGSSFHGKIVVD